jgi:transposase-like protein
MKRKYRTKEQKQAILASADKIGMAATARKYGCAESVIYAWKGAKKAPAMTPGNGDLRQAIRGQVRAQVSAVVREELEAALAELAR